jgi:hypothetical protein
MLSEYIGDSCRDILQANTSILLNLVKDLGFAYDINHYHTLINTFKIDRQCIPEPIPCRLSITKHKRLGKVAHHIKLKHREIENPEKIGQVKNKRRFKENKENYRTDGSGLN